MSRTSKIVRRTLTLGLLAVALVVIGLPAALGWQLAKYHDSYVSQLAVPGVLEVRDVAFSRGILRSRSRVTLAPVAQVCSEKPCPLITVDSVIHHGPIPFTAPPATPGGLHMGLGVIVSRANLGPFFAPTTFKPALPELELVTRVDFAGAVDSNLVLAAARTRASNAQDGTRVTLERLQGSLQTPATHDTLRGQLNWPSFEVVADTGGQVGLQGLSLEFNGDKQTPLYWQHAGLKINGLQVVDAQGESLALQGLLWNANNTAEPGDIAADTLASKFQLRLSQLSLNDRDYGPIILEGQAQGLDIATLESMRSALRSLNTQTLPPELLVLAISGVYQTHMPALLAAGPDLRISRFLASTPDGDVVGDLHVTVAEQSEGDASDLTQVSKRLELTMNLRFPAPMFEAFVRNNLETKESEPTPEQMRMAIEALTEAKLVIAAPEENAYTTQLRIENQNLTVNGKLREGWQELLEALSDENTEYLEDVETGEPILAPADEIP